MTPTPAGQSVTQGATTIVAGAVSAHGPNPAGGKRFKPDTSEIVDVWSWRARKYRVRATVLLLVNLALFCGLCMFTYWLHVARPVEFALESYLEPLRFWGPSTQNLNDFVLFPISVDQTPVYGVVLGLLMAAMAAVPISVSIIYRFGSALPFIAAVFIFAHMPWLALTLTASCILASLRPFRMPFRYGSALLGMLPVLLYLYLATRGTTEILSGSISPERRLLLTGPWLLAILAACMMLAGIIFFARMVNYRPGTVAPVIAIMFATPAVLFYRYVGVDELTYRMLEAEWGPRSARFEPVQDGVALISRLMQDWMRSASRDERRGAILAVWNARADDLGQIKQRVARALLLDVLDDRRAAYQACKDFIADHPQSRYIPNVLFIEARALDVRLDERVLLGPDARRELYTDFPHVQSESVWGSLLAQYPNSPLAVAARLRVAQLRLRKGDADGALAVLAPLAIEDAANLTRDDYLRPRSHLWQSLPAEASLDYEPEPDLREARRLYELILDNRDDPKYGVKPLQELAALDTHRLRYQDQLQRLANAYPDSLLYDNIVVRWAVTLKNRTERAQRLSECIARFPNGDATPHALFELADLEIQVFGLQDEARRQAGIDDLRAIVTRFPQSYWATRAAERLRIQERRFVTTPAEVVPQ